MVIFPNTTGKKKNERLRDFEGNNESKKEYMKINFKDIKECNKDNYRNGGASSAKTHYKKEKNNKFFAKIEVHYQINKDTKEIRLFGDFFF